MISARDRQFSFPLGAKWKFYHQMLEKQFTEPTKDVHFGRNLASFPTTLQQLRAAHPPLENDCPLQPSCGTLSQHPSP